MKNYAVSDKYPHRAGSLMGDVRNAEVALRGIGGFGVLLNAGFTSTRDREQRPHDWVDVSRDLSGEWANVSVHSGDTILNQVAEARLHDGDSIIIGRRYQQLQGEYSSGRHVELTARRIGPKMAVHALDLLSTNGTSIWTNGPTDANFPTNEHHEQPVSGTPFEEEMPDSVASAEDLMARYGQEFTNLELVDYGVLVVILSAHTGRLDKKDKQRISMKVHPDKNITGDAQRSHELYIIALRVLDLHS